MDKTNKDILLKTKMYVAEIHQIFCQECGELIMTIDSEQEKKHLAGMIFDFEERKKIFIAAQDEEVVCSQCAKKFKIPKLCNKNDAWGYIVSIYIAKVELSTYKTFVVDFFSYYEPVRKWTYC